MKLVPITLAIAAAGCRGGDDRAPAAMAREAAAVAPIDAAVAAASAVDAGAAPAAAPDPKAARAALRRGRDQARRHDWREATASFEAAVAAAPDDARAMSELGWAAFRAGDLDRAEQASSAAAAAGGATAKVKAASLYNLGRVKEARGDRDGAASAYRASLALRRNRVVRRHLRAIDRGHTPAPLADAPDAPDAPDSADDDAGMAGPFASIAAYCDAQAASSDDLDDDGGAAVVCTQGSGLAAGPDHLDAPELRVIGVRGDVDDVTCLLALHAHDGWYLWNGIPCATTTAAGTDWAAALALDAPAAGRVLARFAIGTAVRDSGHGHHACAEVAVACELAGAKPACTAAEPIAWAASCPDAPSAGAAPPALRWDATADVSLDADALIIRAPTPARHAPDGLADLSSARVPLR